MKNLLYFQKILFILAIILALSTSSSYSMLSYFFGSSENIEWVKGKTGKALKQQLDRDEYTAVLTFLEKAILEHREETALSWLTQQANLGYPPLQYFLIKYHYNLYTNKSAELKQIQNTLITVIINLILAKADYLLIALQQLQDKAQKGKQTLDSLKKVYKNWFLECANAYEKLAYKIILKLTLNKMAAFLEKDHFINPAWVCATTEYKNEIIFNNPSQNDCLIILGSKSPEEMMQIKKGKITGILKELNSYNSWEEMFLKL